ncbi:MAG: hypothetical protein R3E79_59340 [Caldilineaceae bacterium]
MANTYNPDQIDSWDTQRFFRDWAGAEFLSTLPGDPHHGPRFYGGDRGLGFIILEDLGDEHHSLQNRCWKVTRSRRRSGANPLHDAAG